MNPEEFQQLVEKTVLQYPMSEHQQEERIIELADLVHFVDCFKPSLKISDDQPVGFNIIEEQGSRIGVIVQEENSAASQNMFTSNEEFISFKRNEDLKSIWLVVVNTSLKAVSKFSDDLATKISYAGFDHIFTFNFFAQQVYQFR